MSDRTKRVADILFVIQIMGAVIFCGAYFVRSLSDVTGSSLIQFGLVATFLLFHLALGLGAHRASPSRTSRQTIATYAVWLVLIVAIIVAAGTNPAYIWTEKETTQLTTAITLSGLVVLLVVGSRKRFSDPMIKAFFAIAYKSVPQILLAWKFLAEGASGTPVVSVVVGHLTIIIRLGQIYFLVKEAGWDRNRVWLAISETANELSWVVATIAWVIS